MKKLFISQPMKDKSNEEIEYQRQLAITKARELLGEEIEVLDTFFKDFDGNAVGFLGKSILALSGADVAYFAPGWASARGCKIEHQVCESYDIKIIE